MHEGLEKGKKNLRIWYNADQKLEIEAHTEEVSSNSLEKLVYKPKGVNNLKFFAGINREVTKGNDDDIIAYLNTKNCLEYHLIKFGKKWYRGNQYIFIGFYMEYSRQCFINNDCIAHDIGKFRSFPELDKLNEHQ
jgi:hypothetical protein